jgi:hypothetical protein
MDRDDSPSTVVEAHKVIRTTLFTSRQDQFRTAASSPGKSVGMVDEVQRASRPRISISNPFLIFRLHELT